MIAVQQGDGALLVGTLAFEGAGTLQDELGARGIDGKADAAEEPPQTTVQIEEAEVQSRRRDDPHRSRVGARRPIRGPALGWLSLRCVGQWHYGSNLLVRTSP